MQIQLDYSLMIQIHHFISSDFNRKGDVPSNSTFTVYIKSVGIDIGK